MANSEHLERLRQGMESWNKWRQSNPTAEPDLSGVNLSGADLRGANLNGADLNGADLNGAKLHRAKLHRANLDDANLDKADLDKADLSKSNLSYAKLHRANLDGAKLNGAKLYKTDFNVANLSLADLSGANLSGANLSGADLSGANLTSAEITFANLANANLGDANLSNALLQFSTFRETHLRNTDLSRAVLRSTVLDNLDLSCTVGLDSVLHEGPSTIGIDTVFASGGKIPEIFLRGCGVPDIFIQYVGSLVNQPIQYYSCFISYSTKDQDFAERLHNDLQSKGVRCWFAPHDIQGGKKIHEQIDDAIRTYEKLLLILSPSSMNSEWVNTEIAKARKREASQNRKMLFPVRLVQFEVLKEWECFDADRGKDSAREIREYYIPDFSRWKNDADEYAREFDKLLRDLKQDARD